MLKQDQESLSAPSMDCPCKSGASSWSCFNQSKQDRESLSSLALDCLCQAGLNTWSNNFPFHRTILQILPLCKIMFLGPVGALRDTNTAMNNNALHQKCKHLYCNRSVDNSARHHQCDTQTVNSEKLQQLSTQTLQHTISAVQLQCNIPTVY